MYRNTDAVIRPELTAVVVEAALADKFFIASQIYPPYLSPNKTGEFHKITKSLGEVISSEPGDRTLRAPKTAYKQIERTYEKDHYGCNDRGLEEAIDDSIQRELSKFFDVESTVAKLVLRNMMIDHERRVAARVFNTSVWGSVNSTVSYTDAHLDTADFATDMQEAITRVRKRGEDVNTCIINRNVWNRIRRGKLFREYLFGQMGGSKLVTPAEITGAFGIQNVLIADAVQSVAGKGKTVDDTKIEYIWSSSYIWIGNVQSGDFSAGGAGRTIVWNEDASGLFVTETYRNEKERSDMVRVRQHTEEKEINVCSGTLIATQYA